MTFEQLLLVVLALLALAACVIVARIVRPGSLADRAVAFDALASIIVCGVLVDAARTNDGLRLDLAVALGLLGFLTSVTVARFIEIQDGQES